MVGINAIYSTDNAFAALFFNGRVESWGDQDEGGDSSSVSSLLIDVVEVFSTQTAFAAVLHDRTVVTWGEDARGGNSTSVSAALVGVQQISSTLSHLLQLPR